MLITVLKKQIYFFFTSLATVLSFQDMPFPQATDFFLEISCIQVQRSIDCNFPSRSAVRKIRTTDSALIKREYYSLVLRMKVVFYNKFSQRDSVNMKFSGNSRF